jgi:DNA-binding PadR family transcriptional regulator
VSRYHSSIRTSTKRTIERATALTTTEAGVLGVLAMEGECSGYDLLKHASRSVGHVWAPAKTQLYAVLPRLVGAGLARRRLVRQTERPDKQLYRITKAGRASLGSWLALVEPGETEAFRLRLFLGGLTSVEVLEAQVEQFRHDTEQRLEEYRGIEPTNTRSGHDHFHWLLLRYGIESAEGALRWTDWVLDELRRGDS